MSGVLTRITGWLAPTDDVERHILTARLLGNLKTVLDVGGAPGSLAARLPGAEVTTVNIEQGADIVIEPGPQPLPIPDRRYEGAASIDTLEHIPRADRALFVEEILRVASRRVVVCCPLGTDARRRIEDSDNAWYRQLTGSKHPWISEHLAHGVPTMPELEELFASSAYSAVYRFSGDVRITSRQLRMAETSNVRRGIADIARWVGFRLTHRPDLALSTTASTYTNRVFVVAERRG
jgi:hypothetical protein